MPKEGKKKILFVCLHNSARSQMAEAFLNAFYGDRFEAYSAGTKPTRINPFAVRVMKEAGIDISKNRSKGVKEFSGTRFDQVVSVCDKAREECAFFPGGGKHIHKGFYNPSLFRGAEDEILLGFRRVRDEIREWVIKEFGTG